MDNSMNGMMTKIWGPNLWVGIHCITFGYPLKPTEIQKQNYLTFFKQLGNVLPCKYCRESYNKFITEDITVLNMDTMKDRSSVTRWLYNLHNKVNDKLGMKYGVQYEDVAKRYESYRAKCFKTIKDENNKVTGCTNPLHTNKCYEEAEKKDCPIIDYNVAKKFHKLAKIRNINDDNFYFWNGIEKNNGEINRNKIWDQRNKYCAAIINYMRKNNIPSIEQKGKFKGLPTKLELRLLLCLSSNLSCDKVNTIAQLI